MGRAIKSVEILILVDGHVAMGTLLGEAGFSALVDVIYDDESKFRLLFDTGSDTPALQHNLGILEEDLDSIDILVLSHGHWDHVGGVMDVLAEVDKKIPVLCHPHALAQKIFVREDDTIPIGIQDFFEKDDLEKMTDLILSRDPYQISEGIWSTGEVPRTNEFEKLTGKLLDVVTEIEGETHPDKLLDDLSLVFQLKDENIVILAGCCHAGIVNTANHASTITGSSSIVGIVGGLHLNNASAERMKYTLDTLVGYPLTLVAPCHCTGLRGKAAFMNTFGDTFLHVGVGSKITFPVS
ncbi:MAG: MBL fold metallo-hydrolase [Candidatus Thorarchaeota archaeon]|nr:MBL fold metallo-hydrolase [Candidatus Thorarchaeota archaeon]